ncbi:sigma-70 family RNA polymerase sigma factor [Actinoplanes sp. NBRC 103695]|uniref:sigma-70 family RNA polymerase sigma factor n=1 Tax=Actinoplanes sp. NBRC 103695 TaxID=3032202 RepID=UPI0024A5A560|nr:sigma-70 family RNA polymerase sigma factor [Actinoplanes sp. NBRC 103695]GLZ01129.1 RNA polymerase sigma factor [Actinoplanes sp. NBRC 103695]
MDEPELLALAFSAGRGDRDASTALIRATQRSVRRFLVTLSGLHDADDLVQETYLRAFGALPSFAGRSSVRTWLFAIARRVAADHLRQAYRRPPTAAVPDWAAAAEGVHQHGQTRFDEHVALEDLLARLPADRREAFVATQVLGLSYAEAAEVCGCPVGTIRSRVARARDELIALVAPEAAAG